MHDFYVPAPAWLTGLMATNLQCKLRGRWCGWGVVGGTAVCGRPLIWLGDPTTDPRGHTQPNQTKHNHTTNRVRKNWSMSTTKSFPQNLTSHQFSVCMYMHASFSESHIHSIHWQRWVTWHLFIATGSKFGYIWGQKVSQVL